MLLKPAVIDRSHPLDVHQQSTQPIVPTTACPNAHTISHNNQPNFTLNPLLTNSLSMSLLIPSIVHPNPIQPPNNRPFRWIKSVKRSLPKQPLILQFRPWPERDVRTNYLSARKREQLVEKLTERGEEWLIDREEGSYSACTRISTVLELIINVARGLILASQSLIEACRVRTGVLRCSAC